MHSNIGYIATLCLNLSLLLPLANNAKVDNYVIVLTNVYWVLLGIWWCKFHLMLNAEGNYNFFVVVFQQPRPGPPFPKGEHYLTVGWKQVSGCHQLLAFEYRHFAAQIWEAVKHYKELPYTFVYLIAFFLLADVCNA